MPTDPQDQAKAAWDKAIPLLMGAGMREPNARKVFGRLLSVNTLTADRLLPAIDMAIRNGTGDPLAYLTRAAERIAARGSEDPSLKATWT